MKLSNIYIQTNLLTRARVFQSPAKSTHTWRKQVLSEKTSTFFCDNSLQLRYLNTTLFIHYRTSNFYNIIISPKSTIVLRNFIGGFVFSYLITLIWDYKHFYIGSGVYLQLIFNQFAGYSGTIGKQFKSLNGRVFRLNTYYL